MYKIQQRKTGLFSTGGTIPKWDKNGKIWRMRGHVVSHINQLWKEQLEGYIDADVVKFELVPCEIESISMFVAKAKLRKKEREEREKRQQLNNSKRTEIENLESEIKFAKSILKEKEERLKSLTT